jgi:transcriptional regulator with PAS, ATPase and Fis domain
MRAALSRIAQVARHPTTVLLLGESGSGKEVLARELHRRSPRAHRAMLQLNCAAIPEALIESELFGHERGAFTGAERAHAGVFERAHRSTLLLDEVAELSPAAQAKLLRVLQEGKVRRVGGETEIPIDVRLVAATHRPLAAMVAAGTFREDLYYRLDVFCVEVPALRDRREDLAPLVNVIGRELAARMGATLPPISRGLIAKLAAHDWPGNVRELRNLLESALVLGNGTAFVLPEELSRRSTIRGSRPFDAAVRETIEEVLRATHGKLYGANGAAARLGMPPATLQSKMKKLGIERRRFV